MDLGAAVFYAAAAATLAASLGVVITRSIVYSALLLILALALTGLVYLILLADFLALVQILVYVGTVSILLLFALMLTRPQVTPILNHKGWPLAAIASVALLAVIGFGAMGTDWARLPSATAGARTTAANSGTATRGTTGASSPSSSQTNSARTTSPGASTRISPEQLGTSLFTVWAVPFEIASVVLLVALVGSLLVARATDLAEVEDMESGTDVADRLLPAREIA